MEGNFIKNYSVFWALALVASLTLLVSGGVALWNFALLADEYGIREGGTPFTVLFGIGIIGLVVSLPAFFATRTGGESPKR